MMNGPFTPFGISFPFGLIFIAFIIALKGYTLWHSARRGEKWWFIALLFIQTAGILELVYILFILKKFPLQENKIEKNSPSEEKSEGEEKNNL